MVPCCRLRRGARLTGRAETEPPVEEKVWLRGARPYPGFGMCRRELTTGFKCQSTVLLISLNAKLTFSFPYVCPTFAVLRDTVPSACKSFASRTQAYYLLFKISYQHFPFYKGHATCLIWALKLQFGKIERTNSQGFSYWSLRINLIVWIRSRTVRFVS